MAVSAYSPALHCDPLDSPFPVPWQWILDTYGVCRLKQACESAAGSHHSRNFFYRSSSLYCPNQRYAAYSRICFQGNPLLQNCRVVSTLFVEDLQTGMLQTIVAKSPLAPHPFQTETLLNAPGIIAILRPVSWSESGDRLLARQFEGLFCSSTISDYGVIWDSHSRMIYTLAPSMRAVEHTHAVLMGWSQYNPTQILFRAGCMGDTEWGLWGVDQQGYTMPALPQDRGVIYGETSEIIWSGNS